MADLVESIGQRNDLRFERDGAAAQAVRKSADVHALVMPAHDGHEAAEALHRRQDRCADPRVACHAQPFVIGKS